MAGQPLTEMYSRAKLCKTVPTEQNDQTATDRVKIIHSFSKELLPWSTGQMQSLSQSRPSQRRLHHPQQCSLNSQPRQHLGLSTFPSRKPEQSTSNLAGLGPHHLPLTRPAYPRPQLLPKHHLAPSTKPLPLSSRQPGASTPPC